LNKLPNTLEKILRAGQADRDAVLAKLDELLSGMGDIKRIEAKVDDIRVEIAKINAYVTSVVSKSGGSTNQRKTFSARLYVLTLKLKPEAADVFSDSSMRRQRRSWQRHSRSDVAC
jgi:hypothetical protein